MTDDLEATIDEVRAAAEPPGEDGAAFAAPWQARAFALAVAYRREDDFPWAAFQKRLVEELDGAQSGAEGATGDAETVEETYYDAWLAALERLLVAEGVVGEEELAERVSEFASGERDAAEFVVGDHGHSHDHGHSSDREHGHATEGDHQHAHDE